MNGAAPDFLRMWGFWGIAAGALALLLVFIQIGGPMFEPKPSVGSQIGEIAGDIKRSAWRSFFGLPNEAPQAAGPSIWIYLGMAAPVFGIVAVILSIVSGIRRENWRLPVYATGLGVSAIVFQFFWWVLLVVLGVMLLVAIIENIGDIFSF